MSKEKKEINTTPIFSGLIQDQELTINEKLAYIYLMNYQRFQEKNTTFYNWAENCGLFCRQTLTKLIKQLEQKQYIKYCDLESKYFFYAKNGVGETLNYNNQAFNSFFNSGITFYNIPNNILFSTVLNNREKMVIIFLNNFNNIPAYKIFFSKLGKLSGLNNKFKDIAKSLKDKNIINYEIKYFNKSFNSAFVAGLEINIDGAEKAGEAPSIAAPAPAAEGDLMNIENINIQELENKKEKLENELKENQEKLDGLDIENTFPLIIEKYKNEIETTKEKIKKIDRIFEILATEKKEAPAVAAPSTAPAETENKSLLELIEENNINQFNYQCGKNETDLKEPEIDKSRFFNFYYDDDGNLIYKLPKNEKMLETYKKELKNSLAV